ncbi:cytochrome P450, partial [Bipolaris maydis]
LTVVFIRIPYHIGPRLTRQIWLQISSKRDISDNSNDSLIEYLARRYTTPGSTISLGSRLWIFVLMFTVVFASLHQTATIMTWVTFYLATDLKRQDWLYEEAIELYGRESDMTQMSFRELRKASRTDSFIREVLRMKGDSVNLVRATIRDVNLGGYLIPKGAVVLPVTYLSYRSSRHHIDPDNFDPERWMGSGKFAETTGPGYLAFGLGKWSCPGRGLAVIAEMKCWTIALVHFMRLKMDQNRFQIVDPYNITSVPPKGLIQFSTR